MSLFNTCIITTTTQQRASVYRQLIQHRKDHGIYPAEIDFLVYSDPDGTKTGSGGATLLALDTFSRECLKKVDDHFSFQSKKILIIHAGGNNDTLWPYLPEGLLFTPVPIDSSSTISPVMLDLQINFFLKYPWNPGEIVIAPGDVIIDCETSLLTERRGDVHGFAVTSSFESGSRHGVFNFDSYMHSVTGYYQKATVEFLNSQAAIEGTDQCSVDTGIVSISALFAETILEFGKQSIKSKSIKDGICTGSISFNLYLEVLSAALQGMTYELYKEKVITHSQTNETFLDLTFKTFSRFCLTATLIKNALFHHPDTLKKYLDLCVDLQYRPVDIWYAQGYAELQVKRNSSWIVYNALETKIPLRKGKPVLIESVRKSTFENPLGNNIFTGVKNWETNSTIPEGICIDCRSVPDKDIFCVYNFIDTFNAADTIDNLIFCGVSLRKWLEQRNLDTTDIGISENVCLLRDLPLFCKYESDTFLSGYWYQTIGTQWKNIFLKSKRFSLSQCSAVESALDRDNEREIIRSTVLRSRIINNHGWISVSSNDFKRAFSTNAPPADLENVCSTTSDVLVKAYRKRLLEKVGGAASSVASVGFLANKINEDIFDTRFTIEPEQCVVVRCPVRIDIAGGWTDTPPYTLQHGGAVLNFAANLSGNEPIQVFSKLSKDPIIKISSIDRGISRTVGTFSELSALSKEFDLAVAALNVLGFSNEHSSSLKNLLENIGGGIELTTFCGVPKGAGLGASSILAASIITSLYAMFGKKFSSNKLLDTIIKIEQLLGMGSGWQDPLGGIHGGIKLIQSKAGLIPDPWIQNLNTEMFSNSYSNNRFTLVNTGIARISSNVGRDVVAMMNENIPSYKFTLNYLKSCAFNAAKAISTKDFNSLADVINECRIANERLHSSSSNSALKSLLEELKPYYCAVKLTGAGGGGFALFLSQSSESADNLRKKIESKESNYPKVINFSLNTTGMRVEIL